MKTIETVVMFQFRSSNTEDFSSGKYYEFTMSVLDSTRMVKADGGEWVEVGEDIVHFHPVMVVKCECRRCWDFNESDPDCWVCDGKGFEWESAMAWVNVYTISRCYGGPEEGGWYYDALQFVEGHPVLRAEAEELKELLEERHADREWGNISSVLGGEKLAVYIEDSEAESETRERPHYE